MPDNAIFRNLGVLVVDNDPQVRGLVRAILEAEGSAVFEARDGNQALEVLQRNAPRIQVVVSEAAAPGPASGGLTQQLAAICPGVKILLMTGYAQSPQRPVQHCRVLYKPFSLQALLDAIAGLFANGKSGRP